MISSLHPKCYSGRRPFAHPGGSNVRQGKIVFYSSTWMPFEHLDAFNVDVLICDGLEV